MKAYVWRTGVVEFGENVPEGAIEFAEGKGQKFIEDIQTSCRLAYPTYVDGVRQPDVYLVPGVPEAENGEEAVDAVTAFKRWTYKRNVKYTGIYIDDKYEVYKIEPSGAITSLNPRLDLYNHSPTGFGWGDTGSGSAQLALALLADALDDDEKALRWHQEFKSSNIAKLQQEAPWRLRASLIEYLCNGLRSVENN